MLAPDQVALAHNYRNRIRDLQRTPRGVLDSATLEPLLRGDKMTAEQFKEMLRYVKVNKRKAAEDTLASYAERSTEQL